MLGGVEISKICFDLINRWLFGFFYVLMGCRIVVGCFSWQQFIWRSFLELNIQLPEDGGALLVAGPSDQNLKTIKHHLGVSIASRDGVVHLSGDSSSVGKAAKVLEKLVASAEEGEPMSHEELVDAILRLGRGVVVGEDLSRGLDVYLAGKYIAPKTIGQREYLNKIMGHDLTFCIGPAGTGKTYLAVAAAVHLLKKGLIRKIVLVRPAVEAGEKLGFLPGDMQEKVNPYLRPLLDGLHDMMELEHIQRYMEIDLIEVVPLAFMRGRTLNDAVIIMDEAQNTTKSQMMMFLTRLGYGSKMIVTGDTTQIDLEKPSDSGLIDAVGRLGGLSTVGIQLLENDDIVRHDLVKDIVNAYGRKHDTRTTKSFVLDAIEAGGSGDGVEEITL